MDKVELLKRIAPCGLICHTCAAARGGVIHQHARVISKYLEGFGPFAEMMSALEARLEKYPEFLEVLNLLAEANCDGCRDGIGKFPGCEIARCVKEKGHDFCFECKAFPCEKADFEPLLKSKWLAANERMNRVGPEAYFAETKDMSHYA